VRKAQQKLKRKSLKSNHSGEDPLSVSPNEPSHGSHTRRGSAFLAGDTRSKRSEQTVLCILGLGNPGVEYRDTRHNVGFWLVEHLAERLGLRFRRGFFSPFSIARIDVRDIYRQLGNSAPDTDQLSFETLVLVKPLTYMNRAGKVIPHLLRTFGHRTRFAVAVDQLDLDPGSLRVKKRGGTAGHNGLKSIVAYLDREFWPFYIGIGRPESKDDVISHVLGVPGESERRLLDESINRLSDWILSLPFADFDQAIGEINARVPRDARA
jgi:PTH1 family peptidyl-tRNA hydrolase